MELTRFTGEVVGTFGQPIGVSCREPECTSEAVLLPCNAEGDKGRTHHWGGVHDLGRNTQGNFCETHGLAILARNEKIREQRAVARG